MRALNASFCLMTDIIATKAPLDMVISRSPNIAMSSNNLSMQRASYTCMLSSSVMVSLSRGSKGSDELVLSGGVGLTGGDTSGREATLAIRPPCGFNEKTTTVGRGLSACWGVFRHLRRMLAYFL